MADGTKIKDEVNKVDGEITKVTEKPDGTITRDNPDGTWNITFPKKS
jgi:hypothetical protein